MIIHEPSITHEDTDGRPYHVDERPSAHPRVACFVHRHYGEARFNTKNAERWNSCAFADVNAAAKMGKNHPLDSMPLAAKSLKGKGGSEKDDEADENEYVETDTCKYPGADRLATSIAPPNCNDIHALGFDRVVQFHL